MSWSKKTLPPKIKRNIPGVERKSSLPEGLWSKCPSCEAVLYATDLEANANVCPKCGCHNRINARARIDLLLDSEARFEIGSEVLPVDALKFKDSREYTERLLDATKTTGETDALVVMQGTMKTVPVVVAAFEFSFMGGSMGSVLGERFVRGVQAAVEQGAAFICIPASGGARMQEGLFSLMQMAKTSAALTKLSAARLPFISVLTDPTMGGVSASFAFVGDVVIAEPGALIGFAGPRVVRDTTGKDLPEGFQTAEFLLEHGFLDFITPRKELKDKINLYIDLIQNNEIR